MEHDKKVTLKLWVKGDMSRGKIKIWVHLNFVLVHLNKKS